MNQPWPDSLLADKHPLQWTLVANDQVQPGFGFLRRRIPEHLIWFIIGGRIDVDIDGTHFPMHSGSLLWLPPDVRMSAYLVPHTTPKTAFSFRFSHPGVTSDTKPLLITNASETRPLIDRLYRQANLPGPAAQQQARLLLHVLWHECLQIHQPREGLTTHQQQQLIEWLDQHLAHDPRPSDLAEVVQLSSDYFSRRFRACYGLSPRSWIQQHRMFPRCVLIRKPTSIDCRHC